MRRITTVVIEAKTPFSIGTSELSDFSEAPVITDANGLPFIPGTSIAGVVRDIVDLLKADKTRVFGEELGSKVIFSQGFLLDENQSPVRGLVGFAEDSFLGSFLEKNLPIREYVSIDSKGVASKRGKFDKQVVFRGSRFIFEIETIDESEEVVTEIENALKDRRFRLGGKVRSGLGQFQVIALETVSYDLSEIEGAQAYGSRRRYKVPKEVETYLKYEEIKLTADNSSFLFSQGYGDEDSDVVTAKEFVIEWNKNAVSFKEMFFLPASTIKGALRHRVAFYSNKENKTTLEAKDSPAVEELFGKEKSQENDENTSGKIFIDDIFFQSEKETKLTHVCLDRFTQKPIDGGLFQEKAVFDNLEFTINYFINGSISKESEDALNSALKDLKEGYLQISSGVNRGHGRFKEVV